MSNRVIDVMIAEFDRDIANTLTGRGYVLHGGPIYIPNEDFGTIEQAYVLYEGHGEPISYANLKRLIAEN